MRLVLLAALVLSACGSGDAPAGNAVVTDLTADPAYGSGGMNGFDAGAANEVAALNTPAPLANANSTEANAAEAAETNAANATE